MKEYANFNVPPLKNYKSKETWLKEVYRRNADRIDMVAFGEPHKKGRSAYVQFRQLVYDYEEEGLTVRKALQKVSRNTVFYSREEMTRELIDNAFHGKKKKFLQDIGEKKFDLNRIEWDSTLKQYRYLSEDGTRTLAFISDIKATGYRRGAAQYSTTAFDPEEMMQRAKQRKKKKPKIKAVEKRKKAMGYGRL